MIKNIIISFLKQFGYSLEKIPESYTTSSNIDRPLTMKGALARCVQRGLTINSVIDIGASDGRWSRDCMMFLPKPRYLLIEALQAHEKALKQFKKQNPNVDYVIAVAGRKEGKVFFYDNGSLFGGVASENLFNQNCMELPAVSIDDQIKKHQLQPPYLIKMDTHGFEVPIIEGAANAIKKAELIIIETYPHKLTTDCLKYYEMCIYMEKLGFSPIEIVNLELREYDNSLWEMDTFFIRSDRKEFKTLATQKESPTFAHD